MAKKKPAPETKVESIRHKDKRKNIPTEELRDFIAAAEASPKTMLYPRDPQLVWKGKDEQDRHLATGQIRNSSTDDIACWFIDTDYNGESFFVQAYFTGADEPYEKLKRALKAEIDEAAWSSLYSTISRPFPKPQSGKIAVKVINHYGDEVMKVISV
jgi:adenine-specific DNA-methyltransferase